MSKVFLNSLFCITALFTITSLQADNTSNISHQIAASEYCTFLNEAAKYDPYHLYEEKMSGIIRSGFSGSYTYSIPLGVAETSLLFIDLLSASTYDMWLKNSTPVFNVHEYTLDLNLSTDLDPSLKSNRRRINLLCPLPNGELSQSKKEGRTNAASGWRRFLGGIMALLATSTNSYETVPEEAIYTVDLSQGAMSQAPKTPTLMTRDSAIHPHTSIPASLPISTAADNLEGIKANWNASAEIQYNPQTRTFSSAGTKPDKFLYSLTSVLKRTSEDRAAHRAAIDQIALEVGTDHTRAFQKYFTWRKLIGEPVTPGEINVFVDSLKPNSEEGQTSRNITEFAQRLIATFPHTSPSGAEYTNIPDDNNSGPHVINAILPQPITPFNFRTNYQSTSDTRAAGTQ